MPKKVDPILASWKRALRCEVLHEYSRLLETLIEMEGRLSGAAGYLQTLDGTDPKQAVLGVEIGKLAITYACTVMDHFGLWDGPEAPPPMNLAQAKVMIENVLVDVRERIVLGQLAVGAGDDEEITEEATDAVLSASGTQTTTPTTVAVGRERSGTEGVVPVTKAPHPDQQTDEGVKADKAKLVINPDTFCVEWGGKVCRLKNSMEFRLLQCLAEEPGTAVSHDRLRIRVWEDEIASQDTIYSTISSLRRKLKKAGMGDLKIEADMGTYVLILP
jgi:hypothetical protein